MPLLRGYTLDALVPVWKDKRMPSACICLSISEMSVGARVTVWLRNCAQRLRESEHPADMWFDGGNTVLLREITDALMEGPVILPEMNLDQEIEKVMAGFSPIKQFSR